MFHFKSFWTYTPRSLNVFTLSNSVSPTLRGGGSELGWAKHIHMSLVFFALIIILFSVAQFTMAFVDSCAWLESSLSMTSSRVQSSAYVFVLIVRWNFYIRLLWQLIRFISSILFSWMYLGFLLFLWNFYLRYIYIYMVTLIDYLVTSLYLHYLRVACDFGGWTSLRIPAISFIDQGPTR